LLGENKMKLSHKILYLLAILLALASLAIAITYWSRLPEMIPVHFGISGEPDDWVSRSLFYAFLLPGLQVILLALFVFLYYKPQYSDIPTTMWLMTLDKKYRNHAFDLIRTMLAGTAVWIGVLFTYLTYGMNVVAVNEKDRISSGFMGLIITLMLLWLTYWTFKVYKSTKSAIASMKNK